MLNIYSENAKKILRFDEEEKSYSFIAQRLLNYTKFDTDMG